MYRIVGLSKLHQLERALRISRRSGVSVLVVNTKYGTKEAFLRELRTAEAVIADFDGTLTNGSQWSHLLARLDPVASARNQLAYERCLLPDATLQTEMEQLAASVRDLHESGVTRRDIWQIARRIQLRPGSVELLRRFPEGARDIISWGIWDVIERNLNVVHEVPVTVHCTRLRWRSYCLEQIGKEYDPVTVVTNRNKGAVRDSVRSRLDLPSRKIVVLADGPTDMHMISPDYLTVLIVPTDDPPDRRAWRERELAQLFACSRAILISDSWTPLVQLRTASL